MQYRQQTFVTAALITWSYVFGVLVMILNPVPALAQSASLCSGASPTAGLSSTTPTRLSHPEFESKGWKVMLRTGPSMACDSNPIWADDNLRVEERGIYAGADQQWSLLRFMHNGTQKERWAESRFLEVANGSAGCTAASPSTLFNSPRDRLLSHPKFEANGWKVMLRTGPSMTCESNPIWAEDNLRVEELGTYDGTDQSWSLLRFTHNGTSKQRWAESGFLEAVGGSGGCSGATPSTIFSSPQSRTLSHPEFEAKGWKVMLRTGPSMDCAREPIWADDNLQVDELGTYVAVDQTWSLLRFNDNGKIMQRWAETKFLEIVGGMGGCQGATPSDRFSTPRSRKLSHPDFEAKGWKVMLRTGPSMDCGAEPIWAEDNLRVEELGRYTGSDQSWSLLRFSNNGLIQERWAETKFLEAAGGNGPTGPTTPINPLPNGIPIVIYDTDMGPDIDDALALAALHAYESQGMAHIAAVTLSRNSDTGARYIDLVNTFYARPDIPIGVYRGTTKHDTSEHGYTRDVVNSGKYPYSLDVNRLPHGHLLMRDVLQAAPDNSVIIIQVGFSTNTARLLEDYPNLVARKARLLSVMAGDFVMPEGRAGSHGEFNINVHPNSARTVFARWPNQVVVSEVNLGASVLYPLSSIRNDFNYIADHPIKDSYLNSTYSWHHQNGTSYDMRSWDITSVIAAIEPNVIPRVLGPGKITLTSSNNTSFSNGGGSHFVLAEAAQLSSAQRQQLIDLMIQMTSMPPTGNKPPPSDECGFLQPTSYVPNYVRTTVSHSNYNLRPQPNSDCAPIGLINARSRVKVHAETGNWRFIENLSGSGWGWIYKRSIDGSTRPTIPSRPVTPPPIDWPECEPGLPCPDTPPPIDWPDCEPGLPCPDTPPIDWPDCEPGLPCPDTPPSQNPNLHPLMSSVHIIEYCNTRDELLLLCSSQGFTLPIIERGVEAILRSEIGVTPSQLYAKAAAVCNAAGAADSLACALYTQLAVNLWQYRLEIATVSTLNRAAFELMPGGKCIEIILDAERGEVPGALDSIDCVTSVAGPATGSARPAIRAIVIGADAFANCAPLVMALQNEGSLRSWESAWNSVRCASAALDIASARLEHVRSTQTAGAVNNSDLDSTVRTIEERIAQRRQFLDRGQPIPGGAAALQDILNDLYEIEQELQAIPNVYQRL